MIQEIGIVNDLDERLKLDLYDQEESGMIIKSIDGLGPAKADVNTSKRAGGDGEYYTSSRLQKRNIVMTLIFLEQPDIETVRRKMYRFLAPKRQIIFQVRTDHREMYCVGCVESNEPTIFSEQESAQVSIICADPYFYSLNLQETEFSGVDDGFEFPFSNESLIEDKIELGAIKRNIIEDIYYDGEYRVGVAIYITANADVDGTLNIFNLTTYEQVNIDLHKIVTTVDDETVYGLKTGDKLIFCSETGSKGLTLVRSETTMNVITALGKPVYWFQLQNGYNRMAYQVFDTSGEQIEADIDFAVSNRVAYEGV